MGLLKRGGGVQKQGHWWGEGGGADVACQFLRNVNVIQRYPLFQLFEDFLLFTHLNLKRKLSHVTSYFSIPVVVLSY